MQNSLPYHRNQHALPYYLNYFLHTTAILTLAGLIGNFNALVDQFFVGKISPTYLNIHTLIAYLPFIFATIGRIVGHSAIVIFGKEHQNKSQHIGSSLLGTVLLAGILALFMLLMGQAYFKLFAIPPLAGSSVYLYLQIIAALVLVFITIANFIFITIEKIRYMLFLNIILVTTNTLGNLSA